MRWPRERRVWIPVAVFVGAFLFQVGLQGVMRRHAIERVWFQQWSSEAMMQTAPLEVLRAKPVESLVFLHIQPPALDTLRASLAVWWPEADPVTLLVRVDQGLYVILAALYAALVLVLFRWLKELSGEGPALAGAAIFALHPAAIFYATLLESTLLTTLLIVAAYRELWWLRRDPGRGVTRLCLCFIGLVLTRSLFQWPMALVFVIALLLMRVPRRKVVVVALVIGSVTVGFGFKQWILFGTTSSSSFTGLNLVRSLGNEVRYHAMLFEMPAENELQDSLRPPVLTHETKITGQTNLNHERYLEFNRQLIDAYVRLLREKSAFELVAVYLDNLRIYLSPSSRYTSHVIVDRLFWRGVYDVVFSFPVLIVLLIGAVVTDWRELRGDPLGTTGLLLPLAVIVSASVLAESGENMRFKFFIEPLIFVYLFMAVLRLTRRFSRSDLRG